MGLYSFSNIVRQNVMAPAIIPGKMIIFTVSDVIIFEIFKN